MDVDAGTPDGSSLKIIDLVVDNNRNGVLDPEDPTEETNEETWSATNGAVFLANLDDDNDDAKQDYNDAMVNGTADIADLSPIMVRAWPDAPSDATGTIAVDTASQTKVRIFRVKGDPNLTGSYQAESNLGSIAVSRDELVQGLQLAMEGKDIVRDTISTAWKGYVTLTLTVRSTGQGTLGTDVVKMRLAPLLFQHNLAPTQYVFYTDRGEPESQLLREGIDSLAAGQLFDAYPLSDGTDGDQWTQDFFDVAHMTKPGPNGNAVGMNVAVKTAEYMRPSRNVVTREFLGPDWGALDVSGRKRCDQDVAEYNCSLDSFGNWDVIPPHSSGTGSYPLGRNFWGESPTDNWDQPDQTFRKMVMAQTIQPFMVIDTTWLYVGHVDEISAWVKSNSPRGWAMLYASAAEAMEQMEYINSTYGSLPMFVGKWWADDYGQDSERADTTVGAVLNDADLGTANNRAQTKLDAIELQLRSEIGLTDADIVKLPVLWESISGYLIANMPGAVNLLHADGRVLVSKHFGPVVGGVDYFDNLVKEELAKIGLTSFFVDNWDLYHRMAGEVHCGTNVARTMDQKWWEMVVAQ